MTVEREWRYLEHGKVAHILDRTGMYGLTEAALCGTCPPWPQEWFGTGTQTEYETARDLPRCRRCLRLIVFPTDTSSNTETT